MRRVTPSRRWEQILSCITACCITCNTTLAGAGSFEDVLWQICVVGAMDMSLTQDEFFHAEGLDDRTRL